MAVEKRTQLTVQCPNHRGEFSRILTALARADVNLVAFVGQGRADEGRIMLVPDDVSRASGAIRSEGLEFTSSEVITVSCPSGKGAAAELARTLAEAGINLDFAYATEGMTAGDSMVVFGTSDIEKGIEALS